MLPCHDIDLPCPTQAAVTATVTTSGGGSISFARSLAVMNPKYSLLDWKAANATTSVNGQLPALACRMERRAEVRVVSRSAREASGRSHLQG